jgi:hypothetical protein
VADSPTDGAIRSFQHSAPTTRKQSQPDAEGERVMNHREQQVCPICLSLTELTYCTDCGTPVFERPAAPVSAAALTAE